MPVSIGKQAVVQQGLAQGGHLGAAAVERRHRLARLAVAHQFQHAKQPDGAHLTHRWMPLNQFSHHLAHHLPGLGRFFHQPVGLHHLDHRAGRRQRDGMTVVGQPTHEFALIEGRRDLLAHGHRAQRRITRGQALGHGDDIGLHPPMIHGKPAPGAPKTAHHLVADHHDAVTVAQFAYALQVSLRRHNHPVGPGHRLHQDARNGFGPLVLDDFLQVVEIILAEIRFRNVGIRAVKGGPVAVGIQEVHRARHDARLPGGAARITGGCHRAKAGPVIGAEARENLELSRVPSRQLNGILIGV